MVSSLPRQGASVPKRVLFVAFHFPPCVEVGAYSCAQIARHLTPLNWEPIALSATTGNYDVVDHRVQPPVDVVRTPVIPNPIQVYARLRNALKRTVPSGGAGAVHSDSTAAQSQRGFRQGILDLLSIPDVYVGWLPSAVVVGTWLTVRGRVQLLLSSSPYPTNHLVAYVLAVLTGRPWIAHFRDPWVEDLHETRKDHVTVKLGSWLERAVVRRATRVVCVTERHTELLRRKYSSLSPAKFLTIPNGYDESEWVAAAAEASERNARRPLTISYAGTLYRERSPEPLFRALARLIHDGTLAPQDLSVDFIGWCDAAQGVTIAAMAERYGLGSCVHLVGPLSKGDTFSRLMRSDLLLLLAEDWRLRVPAKVYEYLRARRPVLALAPPHESAIADLYARTGGAWVVDPSDLEGIVGALREVSAAWKEGRASLEPDPRATAEFDRAVLAKRLVEAFDALESARRA